MNMILFLFLVFGNCFAIWKLEWLDEFNSDVLDYNKWEIDVQDSEHCDNQNIGRQNCYTNSTRNVRLINGTLALTAIYEKTLNKYSTSAWIRSAVNFTYGRIDIRAALPRGRLLSPWFKLLSSKQKNRDGNAKHNQVVIANNDQSLNIKYDASLKNYNQNFKDYNLDDYFTNENLVNFHTYSFEWNENHLIWRFDNHMTNKLNITNYKSFINDPVVLSFYLRVGGKQFPNQELTIEHAMKWTCSLLTIDYVRYYKWIDDDQIMQSAALMTNEAQLEQDRKSVSYCPVIMEEIYPREEPVIYTASKPGKNKIVVLVSGVCFLILLILAPLIVWLVLRMRKIRETVTLRTENNHDNNEYYDDINYSDLNCQMEMYEQVDLKGGLYHEYNEITDNVNLRATNLYVQDQKRFRMSKLSSEPDRDYITMVAHLPRSGHSYLHVDQ